MENEKYIRIAKILYSMSMGLDYADGIEYAEEEIQCIAKELEQAGDSLKNVIEIIALDNADQEDVYKKYTKSTINFYVEYCDTFINIVIPTPKLERAKQILDQEYERWMKKDIHIALNKYLIQELHRHNIEAEEEDD